MFDKLLLAACIAVSTSGCDILDRIKPDKSNRTPPATTAFYSAPPVTQPTTVAPVVVAVTEPVVVVTPPEPYVEPWVDPSICVEAWRKPCP